MDKVCFINFYLIASLSFGQIELPKENQLDLRFAPSILDACVMLEGQEQANGDVLISWQKSETATGYTIFAKTPTASNWGAPIGTALWQDTTFLIEKKYLQIKTEIRVVKNGPDYSGYGFILWSKLDEALDHRKKIAILVIDSLLAVNLSFELNQYKNDLISDGYFVREIIVPASFTPPQVKSLIKIMFDENPSIKTSLILIGHIPVPYSGNLNPDGHPDHAGAWPTDLYYADIDGNWTDISITSNPANDVRIVNKPGDGKFDQSIIPSNIDMEVGRIDLSNLPAFSLSEVELTRNYFNKNHAYRKKLIIAENKAVIDDNFGYFSGEAFAASAFNNFSTLIGRDNIKVADYFETLSQSSEISKWAYGCGGGTYTSAGGVGNTDQFSKSNLNNIFSMLFGSYFGDWDVTNSFLRAPLAQGYTLANTWSGRPHHQFHYMAGGETIGFSFMKTVNNPSVYYPNIYNINSKWIHNSLMGDPTLKNEVTRPIKELTASVTQDGVELEWTKSEEPNSAGYLLTYKKMGDPHFLIPLQLSNNLTKYKSFCLPDSATYIFMIRSIQIITNPSGQYYNQSEGLFDTVFVPKSNLKAMFTADQVDNEITLTNQSIDANNYNWFLNDKPFIQSNPLILDSSGTYHIKLIASNTCYKDSITKTITFINSNTIDHHHSIKAVYDAKNKEIIIDSELDIQGVQVYMLNGTLVQSQFGEKIMSVKSLPTGIYFAVIQGKNLEKTSLKFVKME